jgi:thioredoxin 1
LAKVLDVTDNDFEQQVLKSEGIVLVDFWAEWCAPCRQLAPVVKELAAEYGDRVRVVKVDADASPRAPARFSVRALPTLLFFRNGAVVDSVVGAVPKRQIAAKLDALLSA